MSGTTLSSYHNLASSMSGGVRGKSKNGHLYILLRFEISPCLKRHRLNLTKEYALTIISYLRGLRLSHTKVNDGSAWFKAHKKHLWNHWPKKVEREWGGGVDAKWRRRFAAWSLSSPVCGDVRDIEAEETEFASECNRRQGANCANLQIKPCSVRDSYLPLWNLIVNDL